MGDVQKYVGNEESALEELQSLFNAVQSLQMPAFPSYFVSEASVDPMENLHAASNAHAAHDMIIQRVSDRLDVLQYYVLDCHSTMVALAFMFSLFLLVSSCFSHRRAQTAPPIQSSEPIVIEVDKGSANEKKLSA